MMETHDTPIFKRVMYALITIILCVIVVEQVWNYWKLKQGIGKFAYKSSFTEGEPGAYVGQVLDSKWNAWPTHELDVRGIQPRYLIAREILPGVTKAEWWCSYMVVVEPARPIEMEPGPFPIQSPYLNIGKQTK